MSISDIKYDLYYVLPERLCYIYVHVLDLFVSKESTRSSILV